ncbi:hypothetical protein GOODEAATRI_011058, partial [Goodea atripinnis]
MPLPAPCLTPLPMELDSVSVLGFTPQPSHWFILPEPAWLSSPPGIIVKRTITVLCVPATASTDSPEDLNQSAMRLQSVGFFHINCLDHIFFWILHLLPRLRSDSWKLTAGLLFSDPEFLNKPFNFSLCVWLNLGPLSLVVIVKYGQKMDPSPAQQWRASVEHSIACLDSGMEEIISMLHSITPASTLASSKPVSARVPDLPAV